MTREEVNELLNKGFTPEFIMNLESVHHSDEPLEVPVGTSEEEPAPEPVEVVEVSEETSKSNPDTVRIADEIATEVYKKVLSAIQKSNVLDSVIPTETEDTEKEIDNIINSYIK